MFFLLAKEHVRLHTFVMFLDQIQKNEIQSKHVHINVELTFT